MRGFTGGMFPGHTLLKGALALSVQLFCHLEAAAERGQLG